MHRLRHRQGRWLHTRISENLEDVLKREARRRRLPVSLLVRNVLEGAFDLVEELVENGMEVARRSERLAERVRRAADGHAAEDLDDVYGWQELILNRAGSCARCDAALEPGTKAYRGLRDRGGPAIFLCAGCTRRLAERASDQKEEVS